MLVCLILVCVFRPLKFLHSLPQAGQFTGLSFGGAFISDGGGRLCFCWLVDLALAREYKFGSPSRIVLSVFWTKLSLYAAVLNLLVRYFVSTIVLRPICLGSLLVNAWVGSDRMRFRMLVHVDSMYSWMSGILYFVLALLLETRMMRYNL